MREDDEDWRAVGLSNESCDDRGPMVGIVSRYTRGAVLRQSGPDAIHAINEKKPESLREAMVWNSLFSLGCRVLLDIQESRKRSPPALDSHGLVCRGQYPTGAGGGAINFLFASLSLSRRSCSFRNIRWFPWQESQLSFWNVDLWMLWVGEYFQFVIES